MKTVMEFGIVLDKIRKYLLRGYILGVLTNGNGNGEVMKH